MNQKEEGTLVGDFDGIKLKREWEKSLTIFTLEHGRLDVVLPLSEQSA